MHNPQAEQSASQTLPANETAPGSDAAASRPPPPMPREIGGRDGPEPTRYGDWEKAGRCIDF